jgi:hypothetical protein
MENTTVLFCRLLACLLTAAAHLKFFKFPFKFHSLCAANRVGEMRSERPSSFIFVSSNIVSWLTVV